MIKRILICSVFAVNLFSAPDSDGIDIDKVYSEIALKKQKALQQHSIDKNIEIQNNIIKALQVKIDVMKEQLECVQKVDAKTITAQGEFMDCKNKAAKKLNSQYNKLFNK